MYETLALLGLFTFLYSIVAGGLDRTPVNGALVFAFVGFLCGPLGLDILKLDTDNESIRTLAELTLAMVLFIDAANADLGVLKKSFHIPSRMLFFSLAANNLTWHGCRGASLSRTHYI